MALLTPAAARALPLLARPVAPTDLGPQLSDLHLTATDWEAIVGRAGAHRWASWLLIHVRTRNLPVSDPLLAILRRHAAEEMRRSLELSLLLARLQTLFEDPAPAALLLKGRGIEHRAYPPDVLRPSTDIDLLVRPGRLGQVRRFLLQLGLTHQGGTRAGHVQNWRSADGHHVVEVHRTPLDPWRYPAMASTRVVHAWFARAQRVEGRLVPDEVDQTALLLVHLAQMLFADVRHTGDLAQWLIVVQPDPQRVTDRLRDWHCVRTGLAGLSVLLAFAPELAPRWAPMLRHAPADLRQQLARASRWVAWVHYRHQPTDLPPKLEAVGWALHLDNPWPWLVSTTPARVLLPWR